MKSLRHIFAFCILSLTFAATAQTSHKKESSLDKVIIYNSKTLYIEIKGQNNSGKPVKFEHTYLVKGISKVQRDSITRHVTDSLGVN